MEIKDTIAAVYKVLTSKIVYLEKQGAELHTGGEVNTTLYAEDNEIILKFREPFIQIKVTKFGLARVVNLVRPTLKEIRLTMNGTARIISDSLPEFEVDINELVSARTS